MGRKRDGGGKNRFYFILRYSVGKLVPCNLENRPLGNGIGGVSDAICAKCGPPPALFWIINGRLYTFWDHHDDVSHSYQQHHHQHGHRLHCNNCHYYHVSSNRDSDFCQKLRRIV